MITIRQSLLAGIALSASFGLWAQPTQDLPGNPNPPVLEASSNGMNFDMPGTADSGWTTIRYTNNTPLTHFLVLELLPEGKTYQDSIDEVVPVFQDLMDAIIDGEDITPILGDLPLWFFEVVFHGGPGMIAPGETAEATVYLEPGNYTIECYLKFPDGTFHSTLGMVTGLTVSETSNGAREPRSNVDLEISSDDGIQVVGGRLRPGQMTFGVHFADQAVWEHFLNHDVHLVRLHGDVDMAALNNWMNWSAPDGLVDSTGPDSTLPAGVEFMGGMQELPAGETGYFHANLQPGNYALIAEIPDPAARNMLLEFSVPLQR